VVICRCLYSDEVPDPLWSGGSGRYRARATCEKPGPIRNKAIFSRGGAPGAAAGGSRCALRPPLRRPGED